eukprot:m.12067 g.12067  ORF g.12067 m.12067 type:complete len:64 (-) comp9130_c0_seq1:898-1089(-)
MNGTYKRKLKNAYFEYDGEWQNGKRNGMGTLKFKDGGFIQAEVLVGCFSTFRLFLLATFVYFM